MKQIEQMWWREHTIWQDDVAGWRSRPPLSATRRLSASKWHRIKDAWNVIMVEGHVMWMTTQRDASILWSGKNEILTNTYISLVKAIGITCFRAATVGEVQAWCLMSFSRQHSLRRSWCNYLTFLFFWCWGDYEKRIIVLMHSHRKFVKPELILLILGFRFTNENRMLMS
jgi:hypothetical protein